ncbi:MAG: hypothetical protein WC634_04025 [archaeon]
MPDKGRKIPIDVLMEGSGGDLVFREVRASKDDLRDLIEASRNPVIKNNVFKAGDGKRVKL